MFLRQEHEATFLPCAQEPAIEIIDIRTGLWLIRHPQTVMCCSSASIPVVTTRLRLRPSWEAASSPRDRSSARALAPSHFTYGSAAFGWVSSRGHWQSRALAQPQGGQAVSYGFAGHTGVDGEERFVDWIQHHGGLPWQGYLTLGSGSVNWFDTATETGSVLAKPFEHFHFAGNTWSLQNQLDWLGNVWLRCRMIGLVLFSQCETHVPYWHEGAS